MGVDLGQPGGERKRTLTPDELAEMAAGRRKARERRMETLAPQLQESAEQALQVVAPEGVPASLRNAVAEAVATAVTPDEPGEQTDLSRLLAQGIAKVYTDLGLSPPGTTAEMEREITAAAGDTVMRPGPGGKGVVEMTPEEERRREARAEQLTREVWAASGKKTENYLNYLRNSPPMEVYNPESRVVIVNGVKMPLAAGVLRAKMPGRLPGRQSAGPDGKPRWGCAAIAHLVSDWGGARTRELAYQRYAHEIIIHGEADDMADRREAAFEYGDIEIVGR